MNYVIIGGYLAATLGFILAALFLVLFYKRHFASDSLPVEWRSLYIGIGSLAISSALFLLHELIKSGFVLQLASLFSLLAGVMVLDASYVLWRRFMI